ncbi:MAG: hypothetical protein Q9169_007961 [Polycauliona sp. 2 TL-2023]
MFPSQHGSNYFRVGPLRSAADDSVPVDAVTEARQRVRDAQRALEQRTIQEIEDRQEGTEFVPWLERMGWPTYLQGLDRQELMDLVKTPDPEEEPLMTIVWDAMNDMLHHSQQTVKKHAGYFLRIEVVRSEAKQTKYRPLQPYMDPDAMKDYTRPWKQIVAFFVRTRARADEGPVYKFRGQEQSRFDDIIKRARRIRNRRIRREGRDRPGSSSSYSTGTSTGSSSKSSAASDQAMSIRLRGLKAACLRFCIALLARKCRGHEYELPILCAMAVLAVKPQGWRSANEYPPIMSQIIKMARFMVIQMAYQLVDEDHEYAEEEEPDLLAFVTQMVDKCMIRGSQGAMQWILDRRAYGMKIHYTSTAPGNIDWVGDQIRYKHIEFSMHQLRSMVHGLVFETYRALEKILYLSEDDFPRIPWYQLRDDPTREGIGHNFVKDERNPWPVDGQTWLIDRLIESRVLQQRGHIISQDKSQEWCELVDQFHNLLATLVQWVWGQNARGPEFLSMCGWSSGEGQGHNMFIAGGYGSNVPQGSQVELVTRYHKGYNISGDVKVIHRFLPQEVGALMIWNAWLVRPVWDTLQEIHSGGKYRRQWKIWHVDARNREWTPARLSREMKRVSEQAIGVGLTLQPWRDISIAVSRKYLRKGEGRFKHDEEDWDNDGQEDEVEDMQAGHGTHVAGIVYARGIREQDGVVEGMRQKFRRASENWHRFMGFQIPGEGIHGEGKRKQAGWEANAESGRRKRHRRMRTVDVDSELRQMMNDEQAEFRGFQKSVVEAIMSDQERVLAIMPTGGGKSLLFMLPAFCGEGGITIVVVPLIALRQDLHRRCQEMGIDCREWNRRSPPDDARIVLVTPESVRSEDFIRFMNRIRGQERLDRIVIDECHVVLNDQQDFRPRLQELGELNRAQVPMVMLTATLPPVEETRFMKRMWIQPSDVQMFRATTTRKNIQYETFSIRSRTTGDQESELLQMIQGAQASLASHEKLVVYSGRIEDCKSLAEFIGCEAYFHDAEDKKGMFHRFATEERCNTVVATSAFGTGIDVAHIRWVIHVSEPRTLFDYGQESGRAGRDGQMSRAVIVRGRMKGQSHEKSHMDAQRQLVERYLDARCKRVVLDEYLDGRVDREGCEAGEEMCEGCSVGTENEEEGRRLIEEISAGRSHTPSPMEPPEVGHPSPRAPGVVPISTGASIVARHQEEVREAQEKVHKMRELLDCVRERCAYCFITAQRNGSDHYMYHCKMEGCRTIRMECNGWKKRLRGRKELAQYGGCHYCFLPQAWCNRWREKSGAGNAGMYELVKNEKVCQYQDVVIEILAVLIHLQKGFKQQMQGRMPAGMEWEDVSRYWGLRTRWAGIDMYRMVVEVGEGLALSSDG